PVPSPKMSESGPKRVGTEYNLRLGTGATKMRSSKGILCAALIACAVADRISAEQPPPKRRIVIAASTVLDGTGQVRRNTRIVIEGSKIVAIDPKASPVDYDLRGLTVLPGWIDSHVHITWSFGRDGRSAGGGGATQEAAYSAASNAWVTL